MDLRRRLRGLVSKLWGQKGGSESADSRAVLDKGEQTSEIEAPTWEIVGIPAGVQELVRLLQEGGTPVLIRA